MGLKEKLMEALRTGDERRLERLAAHGPRVGRHLLGRLWDPDESIRRQAAVGIGILAAENPELGIELLRRLMWALNDEAATYGVHGVAAIGEIGHRDPKLVEPFVGPVASYAWDDSLRSEILRSLIRIAEAAPRLVGPYLEDLRAHLDHNAPEERELFGRLEDRLRGEDEQA
jgi:hypothetical protein